VLANDPVFSLEVEALVEARDQRTKMSEALTNHARHTCFTCYTLRLMYSCREVNR